MRIISAADVEAALDWDDLIERLRQAFRRGAQVPVRHHHTIETPAGQDATLTPICRPVCQAGMSSSVASWPAGVSIV